MPLKSPLAMTVEEVHSAIWTIQKWTEHHPDRLPLVFTKSKTPTTKAQTPEPRTVPQSAKQSRRGKERAYDPEDERIVEPRRGDIISIREYSNSG